MEANVCLRVCLASQARFAAARGQMSGSYMVGAQNFSKNSMLGSRRYKLHVCALRCWGEEAGWAKKRLNSFSAWGPLGMPEAASWPWGDCGTRQTDQIQAAVCLLKHCGENDRFSAIRNLKLIQHKILVIWERTWMRTRRSWTWTCLFNVLDRCQKKS